MKWTEAFNMLKSGARIRKINWPPDAYLTRSGGKIVCRNGMNPTGTYWDPLLVEDFSADVWAVVYTRFMVKLGCTCLAADAPTRTQAVIDVLNQRDVHTTGPEGFAIYCCTKDGGGAYGRIVWDMVDGIFTPHVSWFEEGSDRPD